MSNKENMQDFTTGSISKKMLRFMLPILAALVLQAMYGAVDLLIVGRFGTTSGMSGVSTGSSIMNLFTFSIASFTASLTIVMGQYIGMKRTETLGKLLGGAICFFLVISVTLTLILVVFARPIAIIMQTPEEALENTIIYIRICGAGYTFIVFYNLISAIFRGIGDSTMPLVFVAIACVVNIVGDLIFVAGFGMNAAGAAVATIVAQAISVIMSLFIIKRKLPYKIEKHDICFNREILKVITIGAPMALQDTLTNLSFIALVAFINRLGLDASSGYGVAQKLQAFVMLIPSAIMQSMASFVAQNVGAKKEERARKAMKFGMIFGGVIGIFIMYLALFQGAAVSSIFTADQAVIARSTEYLKGFAPEAVLTCVLFSYMGYFNGHGKTFFVMCQSLAQSFLIRVPMSYIMSIQVNASLTKIGLAVPTSTVFGILLCTIYYFKGRKSMGEPSI